MFSPRAHGQQNYRDWEAMQAGAVPLLDAAPATHSALYAELPVVMVSNWSEVTPSFLEATWVDMQLRASQGRLDMRKAFLPYWLAQLSQRAQQ